jgi:hypothetical protein
MMIIWGEQGRGESKGGKGVEEKKIGLRNRAFAAFAKGRQRR